MLTICNYSKNTNRNFAIVYYGNQSIQITESLQLNIGNYAKNITKPVQRIIYIYIIIYITPKFLKVEPNLWHVITQFDAKYCKYGEQILKLVEMIIGKGDRKTTENQIANRFQESKTRNCHFDNMLFRSGVCVIAIFILI